MVRSIVAVGAVARGIVAMGAVVGGVWVLLWSEVLLLWSEVLLLWMLWLGCYTCGGGC